MKKFFFTIVAMIAMVAGANAATVNNNTNDDVFCVVADDVYTLSFKLNGSNLDEANQDVTDFMVMLDCMSREDMTTQKEAEQNYFTTLKSVAVQVSDQLTKLAKECNDPCMSVTVSLKNSNNVVLKTMTMYPKNTSKKSF